MQSAAEHVLRRTRSASISPDGRSSAWPWARAAGFDHVSLDLIYGTPGESGSGLGAVGVAALIRPAPTMCRPTR